jgi:hypothetical protein
MRNILAGRAESSAVPAWHEFSHQRMRFQPEKVLMVSCRADFIHEGLLAKTAGGPFLLQFQETRKSVRRFNLTNALGIFLFTTCATDCGNWLIKSAEHGSGELPTIEVPVSRIGVVSPRSLEH